MINKHLFNWSQVVTFFVKRNELQFKKKIVYLCLYISFVIWSSLNKIRSILKDVSVNLFSLEEIFEQLHLSVMTCCKFWTRYQVRCYEYIWLVIKLFSLFMFYKMSFQTINDNSYNCFPLHLLMINLASGCSVKRLWKYFSWL